jgi:acyl carrier protein
MNVPSFTELPKPSTAQDVEWLIRMMIVETLMLEGVDPDALPLGQPGFLAALGANSIDALELIISAEKRFGFQFDSHELRPELLDTLDGFISEVCRKIGILPSAQNAEKL